MKTYETHDNGGRPFFVTVDKNYVTVYKNDMDYDTGVSSRGPEVYSTEASVVFVGHRSKTGDYDGLSDKDGLGNSLLLKVGTKYVFIGHEIFEFKTLPGDTIVDFVSNIGNSDVPYPYAVGDQYVYFMLQWTKGPRFSVVKTFFNESYDAYLQLDSQFWIDYYKNRDRSKTQRDKLVREKMKELKASTYDIPNVKIIVPRQF